MGMKIGACSPGSIVKAEPMYMRCAARSLSTSSSASAGRKRIVIDLVARVSVAVCTCAGQMRLRRLAATINGRSE